MLQMAIHCEEHVIRPGGSAQQFAVLHARPTGADGGIHLVSARHVDPRALLADYLAGAETAATRDGVTALFDRFSGVFQIQPTHNPIGSFAFAGAYDERSDRVQPLKELMDRGYEDAYRQFIEPVVGASGEQLEPKLSRPADDDRAAPISAMLAGLE